MDYSKGYKGITYTITGKNLGYVTFNPATGEMRQVTPIDAVDMLLERFLLNPANFTEANEVIARIKTLPLSDSGV